MFFIAYSLLSHYSNLNPQARDLAVGLALAPMLTLCVVLLWRWSGALIAVSCAATAHGCCAPPGRCCACKFFHRLPGAAGWILLAHGILPLRAHCARAMSPLCTQLADKVHGPLSALELRYTRNVTIAWAVFFLLNLAATFLLFEFAPLRVWSLFANFISLPLILLMFVAEYAVRRRVLPQVQRSGLIATLRVYFADTP